MATINVGASLKASGESIRDMKATFGEILDQSYDLVSKITADWEGKAQAAFLADFQKYKTQLDQLPDTVANLGNAAIQAGEQYEATDAAAANR